MRRRESRPSWWPKKKIGGGNWVQSTEWGTFTFGLVANYWQRDLGGPGFGWLWGRRFVDFPRSRRVLVGPNFCLGCCYLLRATPLQGVRGRKLLPTANHFTGTESGEHPRAAICLPRYFSACLVVLGNQLGVVVVIHPKQTRLPGSVDAQVNS